jgi:uncharacterized alpha-E superfamily protein
MLKRIAGNLFWLTRYLERAEWRARLVDVNYRLLVESPTRGQDGWWPLLAVTGEWDAFAARYETYDERSVLQFFTFDELNLSSTASCINYARKNCRAARNRIPSELWFEINTLYLDSRQWSLEPMLSHGVVPFFAELRDRFYRIAGVIQNTMARDTGYDFLTVGRMLESAENVTRLLDAKYHFLLPQAADVGSPLDLAQWAALLRSASALEPYRSVYGNAIRIEQVVECMLFNPAFPRSARFCVERLKAALGRIAAAGPAANPESPLPTSHSLGRRLLTGSASAAISGGLHEYLMAIQEDCARISDEIFREYLKFE